MPIYEFECESCREHSEIFLKSKDDPVSCPKCGSQKLIKLLSSFAAHGGEREGSAAGENCSCCPAGGSCPSRRGH